MLSKQELPSRTASTMAKLLLALMLVSFSGSISGTEGESSYIVPYHTKWMKDLNNSSRITELTIPGTHDSAADQSHCIENPECAPIYWLASTQTSEISDQLKLGIRFFDVRVAWELDLLSFQMVLNLHHGPYYLHQRFREVLEITLDFVSENPSEFVIFLIKQEHSDTSATSFWDEIRSVVDDYDDDLFFLERRVPTVGEVRGKIVFMARDKSEIPQGFHVTWPSNTKGYEGSDGDLRFVVEDHYSLVTVDDDTKFAEITQNLALAKLCDGCGDPNTLYITFLSGEADPVFGPGHFASYMNPRTVDWLERSRRSTGPRAGVIAMDYAGDPDHAGDALIHAAIAQNRYARDIPRWVGSHNDGGGIAAADIDGNRIPDLIMLSIDHPASGGNQGYYRVGLDLDRDGKVARWLDERAIPWLGGHQQGGGITTADMNGDGTPDLIVFLIDNPSGENKGYYRIGYLNQDGTPDYWTGAKRVPGWIGAESDGAGIAVADINRNNIPDLILLSIDAPSGDNQGYYRIAFDLDEHGDPARWLDPRKIPWRGAHQQGGGLAVADLDGNGEPEMIVFMIDNPSGENQGRYRIGRDLSSSGIVAEWKDFKGPLGWFGKESQGAGAAVAEINGNDTPELIMFWIDNPSGENRAYYRLGMDELGDFD